MAFLSCCRSEVNPTSMRTPWFAEKVATAPRSVAAILRVTNSIAESAGPHEPAHVAERKIEEQEELASAGERTLERLGGGGIVDVDLVEPDERDRLPFVRDLEVRGLQPGNGLSAFVGDEHGDDHHRDVGPELAPTVRARLGCRGTRRSARRRSGRYPGHAANVAARAQNDNPNTWTRHTDFIQTAGSQGWPWPVAMDPAIG